METRRAFNKLLIDIIDISADVEDRGSIAYYLFFLCRKFVVVILHRLLFLTLNVEPITG